MAVGAVGIQGCGGVPGVTHMQGGIQHNIGVPGSQTSAHLHGQVMSSEDERKVNHIKEFVIVVALIYIVSSTFNIEILLFQIHSVRIKSKMRQSRRFISFVIRSLFHSSCQHCFHTFYKYQSCS